MKRIGALKLLLLASAVLSIFAFRSAIAAEERPSFKIQLIDGSEIKGYTSFTVTADTPYGAIKVPSTAIRGILIDSKQGSVSLDAGELSLAVNKGGAITEMKVETIVGTVDVKPEQVHAIQREQKPAGTGVAK